MSSFYYVTSITWQGDRPLHLRWFRVREDYQAGQTRSATLFKPEGTELDWQAALTRFLSYEEATGLVRRLQAMGHEALAIRQVMLPISAEELTDLLLPDGQLNAQMIQGSGRSQYRAFAPNIV